MAKLNILLLRGLTREVRHWGTFPHQLKESQKIDQVLCYDLPGAGERYQETSPLNILDYVEDLRSHLKDKLNEGDWVVMAISMGAMIALEWCKRYPDDFKKIIVINTSAKNLAGPLKRLSLGTMGFILKSLYDQTPSLREKGIKELTTNINMDDSVVEEWIRYSEDRPVSIKNFFRQISAAAMYKAPDHMNIPLLILASENDHLAHVSNSKKLAKKINNSQIKLHNIACHDLPLDDPQWVISNVEEFI